jgi:SAM-dependent methyltransferase
MTARARRRLRGNRADGPGAIAVARPAKRTTFAKLARVLGLRQRRVVDGVKYTERVPSRPHGRKPRPACWEVRFPSGEAMLIHPTEDRVFADLLPGGVTPVHALLGDRITPGVRVLDMGCGTGTGAAWLADRVGPSGGVVAVDADSESIAYARRRFPSAHLGFESGGVETLAGEMPGAFHAAVLPRRGAVLPGYERAIEECWRVVEPGGVLVVELPTPGDAVPDEAPASIAQKVCGVSGRVYEGPADGTRGLVLERPVPIRRPPRPPGVTDAPGGGPDGDPGGRPE